LALRNRIARLEETLAQDLAIEDRALAAASPAERLALSRYLKQENRPGFLKLLETDAARVSPVLAANVRVERDLLHRELAALEAQWEAEGRRHSTSQSDPQFWNLANATANRAHALSLGLVEVIESEAAAVKTLEEVIDPQTDNKTILRIVGRI
jgi:hypothetical protein